MLSSLREQLLEILTTYPSKCLWIAYSGGVDSHVLLHAVAKLRTQLPVVEIRVLHVHHGLQPQADEWVEHCYQTCVKLDIPCEICYVQVTKNQGESLEAAARQVRYQAFIEYLSENDVLLVAQHADDQAETVLLQLLRGAGIDGLAAMPQWSALGKGHLLRPLLNYTRAQILAYAQQENLQWIEDSSNTDLRFERNFLRLQVFPILLQRWPSVSQLIGRVAQHQAQAQTLLQFLAEQDLQLCQGSNSYQLNIKAFSTLTPERQANLIRHWLKMLGLTIPSTVKLQCILTEVLTARNDRQPLVQWQGGEIRRFHGQLYAMSNLPSLPPDSMTITWSPPIQMNLPLGCLQAKLVQATGISTQYSPLEIRFRQGGEQYSVHGHRHRMKKLLQAAHLPTWLRPFIPLIYFKNTLIAIPTIGICEAFQAQAGEEGWDITWSLASSYGL